MLSQPVEAQLTHIYSDVKSNHNSKLKSQLC